ncbi:monovalent cation/H+ antiporter complex subunit F [Nocardioides ferulae]|uniref:monovalent cation/H+ antiporter complex subunit F n=1 Tax=Nocardioides ferulae TaxID=2340821 RepID=UPI00197D63E6|nr:monovalent cation/H+ antiporter complex subunit F [Nocardioides ferulae]
MSNVELSLDPVLDIALLMLSAALGVAMLRVARGPTDADRALAADVGFAVLIAAVAILAVRLDEPTLYSLVMVATLAGFLTTVALARLVERRSP